MLWYTNREKRSGAFAHTRSESRFRVNKSAVCICAVSLLCEASVSFAHFLFLEVPLISTKELLINDDIKVKEVRAFDENNNPMGIMDIDKARNYAYDHGFDIVLIAPQAEPPVCRVMDYGKFCYERDKKEKENRKKQQTVEIKEVQLSCRIEAHDFETKVNRAKKFLSEGNKVRVCLRFKGREMAHQDRGHEVIERFIEACSELGSVDKKPVLEGRQISLNIIPIKKA